MRVVASSPKFVSSFPAKDRAIKYEMVQLSMVLQCRHCAPSGCNTACKVQLMPVGGLEAGHHWILGLPRTPLMQFPDKIACLLAMYIHGTQLSQCEEPGGLDGERGYVASADSTKVLWTVMQPVPELHGHLSVLACRVGHISILVPKKWSG